MNRNCQSPDRSVGEPSADTSLATSGTLGTFNPMLRLRVLPRAIVRLRCACQCRAPATLRLHIDNARSAGKLRALRRTRSDSLKPSAVGAMEQSSGRKLVRPQTTSRAALWPKRGPTTRARCSRRNHFSRRPVGRIGLCRFMPAQSVGQHEACNTRCARCPMLCAGGATGRVEHSNGRIRAPRAKAGHLDAGAERQR